MTTAPEDMAGRQVAEFVGAPAEERSVWHPRTVLPELVWMLALIFGYELARLVVVNSAAALANARTLWDVERALHLPSEAAAQRLVLDHPTLLRLINHFYASAHFPVTAVFLFWVYAFRHDAWRWVRNAMTVFTAAALVIAALLPLAPPRLIAAFGLVDTGRAMGQSVYPASPHNGLANQFAAMPSVHVGWALLVGICVVVVARGWWRWVVLLHPLVTAAVVTLTANHYWADTIVAALLVWAALAMTFVARHRPRGGRPPVAGSSSDGGRRRLDVTV
jgi:PAP2 superfamily